MSGGQVDLPITVLAVYGGGASNAAQHSDAVPPSLLNVGGIDVVVPATPADAKGLLTSALRSNTPTFFLAGAGLGATAGEVPDGDYATPLGKAAILTEGNDVTIVTIGSTLRAAQEATKALTADGISVELIDIRSLVPLDEEAIFRSVAKTGRLIVVDEGRERCSAASEIAAATAEKAFSSLRAPIARVASPNVSLPYAPIAEAAVMPSADRIIRAARGLVGHASEMAAE
jgi:acetoin:2,6-dichlorophenolindophenol oxidoreductase subunit beta